LPARIFVHHILTVTQPSPPQVLRFGVFEVNLPARELRKHGVRVRLPGQPFSILSLLLEKPGEVVTREEMRARLWSSDTFVDFEHSLNSAIKKLRAALGDSPENSRYVETIPRVGYRFIAPVEEVLPREASAKSAPSAEAPPSGQPEPSPRATGPRALWLALAGIAAVVAIAAAGYFLHSRSRSATVAPSGKVMLAVLPFENLTGDPAQDYLSDGMTEETIAQLGSLDPSRLGVIARTSVMHYKNAHVPLDQVGRELGVQYVLEGSVRRDAEKLRVTTQFIRVNDQSRVWSQEYDRELSNLLALQAEIAADVSRQINTAIGGTSRSLFAATLPSSPEAYAAYDLYLKGLFYWSKRTVGDFKKAAVFFQQAIDKDPNYAPAYAGLANTYALQSAWHQVPQNVYVPKARAAALKALQIDDSLAEAHTALALIAENYDYDWPTAEREYRRSIELNPSYATAHQWYAECLTWQGRFDEALAESERARQLDPLSFIIETDHGAILYFSRQYDRAVPQLRTAIEMQPSSARAHGVLVSALVQAGQFDQAEKEAEIMKPILGVMPWAWVAYIEGHRGHQEQASQALVKFEQSLPLVNFDPLTDELLAYSGAGQNEKVIALLQKAYAEHSNALVAIKVDPNLDAVRRDPRFQQLLRNVGLDGKPQDKRAAK
jgi:TolB-like protein/DNA-binding winged helix-turn-helix (wHTH) protein/Tfp pilus assembly protein PilF